MLAMFWKAMKCNAQKFKDSKIFYLYVVNPKEPSNIWDKVASKECSDTMASTFTDFIKFGLKTKVLNQ